MTDPRKIIAANWGAVKDRIDAAASRADRDPQTVRVVAVTKYVDAETAGILPTIGLKTLGESRPQTLWEKADQLGQDAGIEWHLVGSLQRNKIRRTLPLVALIHSVDSFKLLQATERIAVELQQAVDVLIEVNVSGEESKQGLKVADVQPLLQQAAGFLQTTRIRGLMAMAGLHSTSEQQRQEFAYLRELRDSLLGQAGLNESPQIELTELSMGMSDDFEIAIEEGATIVRLGSVLFEGLT